MAICLYTTSNTMLLVTVIQTLWWCNLCIDLASFTSGIFKGAVFKSLDGIIISANCKLRKIYTMKMKPQDTIDKEEDIFGSPILEKEPSDFIPRSCQITTEVPQVTQVLDLGKVHQSEAKPLMSPEIDQLSNQTQKLPQISRNLDKSRIAFGTRVLPTPPPTSRKVTPKSSTETTRSTGRQVTSAQQLSQEMEDFKAQTQERESIAFNRLSRQRSKENFQDTRNKEIHSH
ncbi:hypothetical protein GDO86_007073, partial [Hymenochirus boettgeri]